MTLSDGSYSPRPGDWDPTIKPPFPAATFRDKFGWAVYWMYDRFGDRLSPEECNSIVRVLWNRAGNEPMTLPGNSNSEGD